MNRFGRFCCFDKMKKRNHLQVSFKVYNQHQPMLLPPSLNELIVPEHPVRVVNSIMDKVDIDPLLKKYKPGGCTSYHPRMLLKVLVFAYINNVYSRLIRFLLKAIGNKWREFSFEGCI
jgi:hypothetical protein